MNKNEIVTLKIEDIGHDGEGIGKFNGYTLFIKDTIIGDVVEAKIIKAKKNYGYAKLMAIIESSPDRIEPICSISKQCGGCQIQSLNYKKQLEFKKNKVMSNLQKIGGFSKEYIEQVTSNTLGMEHPFYYRNKAQFPIRMNNNGNVQIGFYAGRTHSVIDTEHCFIQGKENEKIIQKLKQFLTKYNISIYNEETHTGLVRHILTRIGEITGEIMVCLIINGCSLPYADDFVNEMLEIDGMKSITININRQKGNVILGDEVQVLWGQSYITDYIGNIQYQISPLSFYQVNSQQTKVIYETALEFAHLTGEEFVWDLYCGIGTISLFLAQKAKQVYGVEVIPQAIEDAVNNAKINNIHNVEFFVGRAEEVVPNKFQEDHFYPDVVVVDPPRKGCDETLLQTIIEVKPERIVYVSCDSATLARDLKYLCKREYEIRKIQPVDAFCQTVHVETVILLQKKNT